MLRWRPVVSSSVTRSPSPSTSRRSSRPSQLLQRRRQLGALPDRSLGIEFGGEGSPADHVGLYACTSQVLLEVTHRLLSGTHDDVVDREYARTGAVGAEADVQAVVVDAFVVDA